MVDGIIEAKPSPRTSLLNILKEGDPPYTNHAILLIFGYLFGGR
jgi:hypothetical protein